MRSTCNKLQWVSLFTFSSVDLQTSSKLILQRSIFTSMNFNNCVFVFIYLLYSRNTPATYQAPYMANDEWSYTSTVSNNNPNKPRDCMLQKSLTNLRAPLELKHNIAALSRTIVHEKVSLICSLRAVRAHSMQQMSFTDRKSTRLNSSHVKRSRMPSSA